MTRKHRQTVRIFTNVVVAIPLVVALGFLLWLQVAPGQVRELAGSASVSLQAGEAVPELELEDQRGGTVSLRELVGRQGAAILLVDPDCKHCHTEMVALTRLARAQGGGGLPLVIVSVGAPERVSELRASFPSLPFYHDVDDTLLVQYGLRAVPVLLVADGTGRLRQVRGGIQGEAYLGEVFRALRAG